MRYGAELSNRRIAAVQDLNTVYGEDVNPETDHPYLYSILLFAFFDRAQPVSIS
jgi:hypothetical protein